MHIHKYFVSELVEQVIASRYSMVVHGCKRTQNAITIHKPKTILFFFFFLIIKPKTIQIYSEQN